MEQTIGSASIAVGFDEHVSISNSRVSNQRLARNPMKDPLPAANFRRRSRGDASLALYSQPYRPGPGGPPHHDRAELHRYFRWPHRSIKR